jgi:Tol biopolymer transport system component
MLSDDGQKIIFLRGKTSKSGSAHADVYTVNADGSNLRRLLPPEWLATLPKGTGRGAALPVFVPGTHRVLFETSLCQSPADDAPCSIGLFSADADSGEIKTLLPPGKAQGANPQASFTVSPDGKLIAVASVGHVDILDVDGQLVRGGIFLYTPSTVETLYAKIFWLPDSSGLIAALPTNTYHIAAYNKDVSSYAIWRYTLADSAAEAIPVDPSPMNLLGEADKFLVSPDGNWLLYGGNGPSESSIYLADLSNGHVQPLTDNPQPGFSWSPDSQRFFGQNFAGVIGERAAQVSKKSFEVLRWMDATHFICRFCGQDDTKPYVAEIAGDELVLYRLPPAMEDDAYLLILPQNKSRE